MELILFKNFKVEEAKLNSRCHLSLSYFVSPPNKRNAIAPGLIRHEGARLLYRVRAGGSASEVHLQFFVTLHVFYSRIINRSMPPYKTQMTFAVQETWLEVRLV